VIALSNLTRSKTGIYRYRRRVPDALRSALRLTEIVISLRTRNERDVPRLYARVHANVETQFAAARAAGNLSSDVLFEKALLALRRIDFKPGMQLDPLIASDAIDNVLEHAGFSHIDEFADVISEGPPSHETELVQSQIAILQGMEKFDSFASRETFSNLSYVTRSDDPWGCHELDLQPDPLTLISCLV
jgi:hypothetical protein